MCGICYKAAPDHAKTAGPHSTQTWLSCQRREHKLCSYCSTDKFRDWTATESDQECLTSENTKRKGITWPEGRWLVKKHRDGVAPWPPLANPMPGGAQSCDQQPGELLCTVQGHPHEKCCTKTEQHNTIPIPARTTKYTRPCFSIFFWSKLSGYGNGKLRMSPSDSGTRGYILWLHINFSIKKNTSQVGIVSTCNFIFFFPWIWDLGI